jgi:quercetin dioxygenase-like cupin family protein
MAQPHAAPGEIIDVRPLGARLADAASTAFVKAEQIEIARIVLHAGKEMPEHSAPGEITLQCLEGSVELRALGRTQTMRAGDLVYLGCDQPHGLRALEDSSLLLTIRLSGGHDTLGASA